eukprot:TRINITY_DN24570_c0_g1_i1.p1 TRINITY_DN24570_c0_g1~~TRINITY_DN24570_c0_g1_i1.p1  ORF type:complete len:247 (-),score=27.51 TRINITY_DN24570_c0_g1_i1:106-846(-)
MPRRQPREGLQYSDFPAWECLRFSSPNAYEALKASTLQRSPTLTTYNSTEGFQSEFQLTGGLSAGSHRLKHHRHHCRDHDDSHHGSRHSHSGHSDEKGRHRHHSSHGHRRSSSRSGSSAGGHSHHSHSHRHRHRSSPSSIMSQSTSALPDVKSLDMANSGGGKSRIAPELRKPAGKGQGTASSLPECFWASDAPSSTFNNISLSDEVGAESSEPEWKRLPRAISKHGFSRTPQGAFFSYSIGSGLL